MELDGIPSTASGRLTWLIRNITMANTRTLECNASGQDIKNGNVFIHESKLLGTGQYIPSPR